MLSAAIAEALEQRTLLSGLTTLTEFNGADGANPSGGPIFSGNTLFGTTQGGTPSGMGEIYSLPVTGGTPTMLAPFNGLDGATPAAGLLLDSGTLYGTTELGGANNQGTVFAEATDGGTPTVLGSFATTTGFNPQGDLVLVGTTLYGTTSSGGPGGDGDIFSLPLAGGTPTILASFSTSPPVADIAIANNVIYGETSAGGSGNDGEVFSLPITGSTPTVLASFNGIDGKVPIGGLTVVGDTLYGTTSGGGANSAGVVFSLPITGGTPTVLASFDGATSGSGPEAGLTIIGNTIFGTTSSSGPSLDGTVFSLPIAGGTPTVLAAFNGGNGQGPTGVLAIDAAGDLFGTTFNGGLAVNNGTVFELPATALPSPAAQLTISGPPPTTVTGAILSPPITVDVEDSGGNIVATESSTVTLSIASGPAGATIGGAASVAAVNGVATFNNLSLSTAGTYTLTATDGALSPATSGNVTIVSPPTIGTLDPTFGTQGVASHNVGLTSTDGEVVQADGKTVIAGTAGVAGSQSFAVTRFNTDGSLDTTFGDNGVADTSFGGDDQPAGVALLPNGDILLAGTDTTASAGQTVGSQFALAAFTPAGVLDPAFGNGTGQVLTSFSTTAGSLANDVVHGLVVGPDGTIYVVGSSDASGHGTDFAIAAYNDNGTADTTFNGSGRELLDFSGGNDSANAAVVQSDGEIVFAGSTENTNTGVTSIALARLTSNGALDSHFGTNGQIVTSLRGVADVATSLALAPKGQIVVGGVSATGSFSAGTLAADFAIVQYTSAGKLDHTFNHTGFAITSFGQDSAVTSVLVQSNGEIVASGKTASGFGSGSLGIAVARYTSNGALDPTFNNGGKITITLSGPSAVAIPQQTPTALAPLDTEDTLRQEFEAFLSNAQGIVATTPGGNLAIAGNSGGFTEEGQLVAIGIDLAASLLAKLPPSLKAGASVAITISLTEVGSILASGVVSVELLLSDASSVGASETQLFSRPEALKLKPRQSKSFKIKVKLSRALAAGNYDFVAEVNPGSLRDLNPANNIVFKGPFAVP